MVIGGMTVTEIIVTNKNDALIAAIQDGGFINRKGYSVILKPSETQPDIKTHIFAGMSFCYPPASEEEYRDAYQEYVARCSVTKASAL